MSREMKHSGIEWVKQIPSNWNIIKGRHLLFLSNRPVRPTDDVVTCFRDGEVILRSERRTEGFTMSDKEIGYQGINEGDIVIHGMDGFAGAMGVSKSTGKGSPVLIVCNPKENDSPQYIIYYLRSLAMTNVFLALATGIRERSCDLRWKKIAELPFLRPSFSEQQKIANYLDKLCGEVDEMIALQEQMIEELKAYKQSIITEAVTKGLNPNVPMKDSGIDWIGEVPEHWEIGRISLFFFVTKLAGFEYTDTLMNTISPDGCVPIVRAQNVRMFKFNKEGISEFTDMETSLLLNRCSLNQKALLLTFIGAGIGDVCLFNETQRFHLAPNVAKLELNGAYKSNIQEEYVMYYLGSDAGKGEINKISKASAQASLSMSTIRKIAFTLPPLSEQQSIASYLDTKCAEIDDLISIKQAKIEELKEYKKSVIYEYVTGKKEVV